MSRLSSFLIKPELFIASQLKYRKLLLLSHPVRYVQSSANNTGPNQASAAEEIPLKDISEIPGPKCYPIIGCLPYLLSNKHYNTGYAYKMWDSLFNDFGDLIYMKLPFSPPIVGTINPEHVEIYMKSTLNNPIREAFKSMKSVRDSAPNNFFNKKTGLLTENGEEWSRLRSKSQAPILKPKNVAMYLPQVDKATMKFMDRIDALQMENKDGRVPDDFQQEIYKWALECVGLVALNKQLGCLDPDIKEDSTPMQLLNNANLIFASLQKTEIVGFKSWKLYRSQAYIDLETAHNAFLDAAIESIHEARHTLEEAKKKGDPNLKLSILETFLQTEGLSESDVATIVMDLLLAGVDTTSHTLGFTLYNMSKNPQCQRKLQEEIDRVMGDSTEILAEHISEMKYLSYVLKESLRIYPLAIKNARVLVNDIILSGYKIPKGTLVTSDHRIMGLDENMYNKATEFIPERWARDRPLGDIHPFASLPFSHGKRLCIGKRIAEQDIYSFLIRAFQKYNLTFESDKKMDINTSKFVSTPAIPLAFKFHHR